MRSSNCQVIKYIKKENYTLEIGEGRERLILLLSNSSHLMSRRASFCVAGVLSGLWSGLHYVKTHHCLLLN